MPAGEDVTVPLPLPTLATVKVKVVWAVWLKVAVTALSASIVTTHGPVPWQAPLQPSKVESVAGVAVSVSWIPRG